MCYESSDFQLLPPVLTLIVDWVPAVWHTHCEAWSVAPLVPQWCVTPHSVCGGVVPYWCGVFGGVVPSGCVVQFLSPMCSPPFATGVGWQLGARLAGYIQYSIWTPPSKCSLDATFLQSNQLLKSWFFFYWNSDQINKSYKSCIPQKKMKVCKKAFLVLKLDPDFSSIKDS